MYLDGIVYKQCFVGMTSSELRLACDRDDGGEWRMRKYSKLEFEEKTFYYNLRVRQSPEPIANSVTGRVDSGFKFIRPCFDTCYLIYVLDRYLYYIGFDSADPDVRIEKIKSVWEWMVDSIAMDIESSISVSRVAYIRTGVGKGYISRPATTKVITSSGQCNARYPRDFDEDMVKKLSYEATRSIREGGPIVFGL